MGTHLDRRRQFRGTLLQQVGHILARMLGSSKEE
jgi:hypothetical protein